MPSFAQLNGFREDLDEIYRQAVRDVGERHYRHLVRTERWVNFFTFLGYATAWLGTNPISILALALGQTARWTILAHHILHRGYDRIPGAAHRHTTRGFAQSWRRFVDWPDWMLPAAWKLEHNLLHHGHTNETSDPDLVEENWQVIRNAGGPLSFKMALAAFFALTWKLTYYAPNTLWLLRRKEALKRDPVPGTSLDEVQLDEPAWGYHGLKIMLPTSRGGLAFWWQCILPYLGYRFVLMPLLFFPLGYEASLAVLINSVLAELLTNVHAFVVVVPNHAGPDLYRFSGPSRNKGEFYYRQVVASTNYPGGVGWRDFLYGYLNYQIEHHLWPNLPALTYREIAPKVQAACQKHGVPYTVEPVRVRFWKLMQLMSGRASMKWANEAPLSDGPPAA